MSLRPNARTEVRRNRYKVTVDAEEGRRRREDNMVEIRKHKREENILKKRREGLLAPQTQPQLFSSGAGSEKKLESLQAIVAGVWSDDRGAQLEATAQFRKLLSIERSPPINEVVQSGVVPRFVEFLARDDFPQLQFEAAWALTNVASGTSENTRVVIDHGAVPIFVKLLGSPADDVREQEMLLETPLNAVTWSLAMGPWCLCWHNLASMQRYLCCEMLPGLRQIFAGQSQLFQPLSVLSIQMMRKSLQMLAGPCHISQMLLMTKSKLLLMQVSALDLLSSCLHY